VQHRRMTRLLGLLALFGLALAALLYWSSQYHLTDLSRPSDDGAHAEGDPNTPGIGAERFPASRQLVQSTPIALASSRTRPTLTVAEIASLRDRLRREMDYYQSNIRESQLTQAATASGALKEAEARVMMARLAIAAELLDKGNYVLFEGSIVPPIPDGFTYYYFSGACRRDGQKYGICLLIDSSLPLVRDSSRHYREAEIFFLDESAGQFNELPYSKRRERVEQHIAAKKEMAALAKDKSIDVDTKRKRLQELESQLIDPRFQFDPTSYYFIVPRQ